MASNVKINGGHEMKTQRQGKEGSKSFSNGHLNGHTNGHPEGHAMREDKSDWHPVRASYMALNAVNPIRQIVDKMTITPNPNKKMIALSIGDPTVYGNLPVCPEIMKAIEESLKSQLWNGYGPAIGYEKSRAVVAEDRYEANCPYTHNDVVLTVGCSGALAMCITVLAEAGQNILVPKPGFPFYQLVAESLGIETRYYDLVAEKSWEIDLEQMESLIDANTATIIVNNPSNPCGSVWSEKHIRDIIKVVEKHRLPLVSDEVYADFVFEGEKFISFASISTAVPILSCGGLTKKFLIPGWRFGWILIHDPLHLFDLEVRKALLMQAQTLLGPSSLIQGALPAIFKTTPQNYFDKAIRLCHTNAKHLYSAFKKINGLKPIMPEGAMYMMVGLDYKYLPSIKDDIDFTEKLLQEQSVFCLPSSCFKCKDYFRIVLTIPEDKVREACQRIEEFCEEQKALLY